MKESKLLKFNIYVLPGYVARLGSYPRVVVKLYLRHLLVPVPYRTCTTRLHVVPVGAPYNIVANHDNNGMLGSSAGCFNQVEVPALAGGSKYDKCTVVRRHG